MNKLSVQTKEDLIYWNNRWENKKYSYSTNFAQKAFQIIKDKDLETLLDLGCGSGNDSKYFHDKGLKVTAVDYSKSAIKLLLSNSVDINCREMDIAKLKLPDKSFDVVYAHLSLHYFDDETTSKIFNDIYDTLTPGGYLFVKCRSTEDPLYGQGEETEKDFFIATHVRHFFTREYMKNKLEKFKIVSLRRTKSPKGMFIQAIAQKQ